VLLRATRDPELRVSGSSDCWQVRCRRSGRFWPEARRTGSLHEPLREHAGAGQDGRTGGLFPLSHDRQLRGALLNLLEPVRRQPVSRDKACCAESRGSASSQPWFRFAAHRSSLLNAQDVAFIDEEAQTRIFCDPK
jgi:hypothetical protein